jgi:hypothetical protein
MARAIPLSRLAQYRPGPAFQLVCGLALAFAVAMFAIGPDRLIAQIEGDRGIAPIATSSDIEVGGIEVNVSGDSGEEAQLEGWQIARRKAWEKIGGPKMSDGQLDSMVNAIIIQDEQIGPRRYVATLGVIFDRAKAGQYISRANGGGSARRSAPLLVIPVLYSGGARQVFEVRSPWQKAWANFQTAASPIDYVRPVGAGGDSLILNAGQPGRRSRVWWRSVLDEFGAADVVTPIARLEREWPGGTVKGTFSARYGPDNRLLETFTLTAPDEAGVNAMMNKALVRIDLIYRDALAEGKLKPDPTLNAEQQAFGSALAALRAALLKDSPAAQAPSSGSGEAGSASSGPAAPETSAPTVSTITVQFASPDAAAVDAALSSVRGAPGVQSAATTSIAIGGTSVMRVTASGGIDALASALRSRGWQVVVGNGALSIRR